MNINSNNSEINRIKKKRKEPKLVVLIIFLSVLVIVGTPIIINELYKIDKGYYTVWNANDVLAYTGTIISAIGTIVLGVVAWKQNTRLLKVEETTFLAANSSAALLIEVKLGGIKTIVGHLGFHEEQVVFSEEMLHMDSQPGDYSSIEVSCKIEPLDVSQHIALVNVNHVLLAADDKNNNQQVVLDLCNTNSDFTRVAISRKYDRFNITIVLSKSEKHSLVNAVNTMYSKIFMDLEMTLVTNKSVKTKLLCRATLRDPEYDDNEGVYCNFKTTEDDPPMCFWKGTSIIDSNKVRIKQLMGGTVDIDSEAEDYDS
jgi:hypothetical protein